IRLAPGDPALARLGLEADDASIAALRRDFALDQSIVLQYVRWLSHVLTGDFGRSLQTGRPVLPLLLGALGPTMLLSLAALVLS
ncbi:ABC transporter permease, partial [Pseudomonas sp. BAgro211]|nr:ABC transporter permease [Pseudomonas sp. BAgro211]